MNEESILQEDIDAAHSAAHFFKGERLEPFSIDRQFVWQRMTQDVRPLEEDCWIVFLCTLRGDEGEDLMDNSTPAGKRELRKQFKQWCHTVGLSILDENPVRKEVRELANQIWTEIMSSTFTEKGSTGGGND